MGPIAEQWLNEQTKVEILTVIETSQNQGVSARRSCSILAIAHRRIVRWQQRARQGQSLANLTPGPSEPLHRVLPEEIDPIVAMARSQEYVGLSHRILAVTAWDKGLFQASFSTVYRVLKERNLMTARGPGGAHNGNSKAPVRKDLTGPNQRWCWDISYLMTFQKGVYLYLYLLLDEWSRKAIQWRISWHQTAQESRLLLEGGLVAQNILDLPEDQRPEVINDRGRQMKAKPIQRLCEDHHMPQLFARPRTPNDNPYIKSAFSIVKRAPEYPGRFLDDDQAVACFNRYFTWYDTRAWPAREITSSGGCQDFLEMSSFSGSSWLGTSIQSRGTPRFTSAFLRLHTTTGARAVPFAWSTPLTAVSRCALPKSAGALALTAEAANCYLAARVVVMRCCERRAPTRAA